MIEPDALADLCCRRAFGPHHVEAPRPLGARKAVVEPKKRATSGKVDAVTGAMTAAVGLYAAPSLWAHPAAHTT